ncbi:MAG: CPBP family intramembrane metalloprotease [Candidatus Schekmanbacteria bacterium]|nr:CPBP family intramembrane metalloprotease [Candidatus Schekmanbacteria bacterium]
MPRAPAPDDPTPALSAAAAAAWILGERGCEHAVAWVASPHGGLAPGLVAQALAVAAAGITWRWRGVSVGRALGLSTRAARPVIRACLGWTAAVGLAYGVVLGVSAWAGVFGREAMSRFLPDLPAGPFILPHVVAVALLFPVFEEVLYRGILYPPMRETFGRPAAVVLTALVFALAHRAVPLPVNQFVGGVIFALAYDRERTLIVPIALHVAGNSALLALARFGHWQ